MEINAAGLAIIKESEGVVLTAIRDVAGVWTIGYGHTGPDVGPGLTITQAQADALLAADVASFSQAVTLLVTGPTITVDTNVNQFSAMVSLAYNIGAAAFKSSTLLKDHLAGDFAAAQQQFAVWDKAHVDGALVVLSALTERRADEAALYGTSVEPQQPPPQPEQATITIGGTTWTGTLVKTAGAAVIGAGLGAGGMATQLPPAPAPVVVAPAPSAPDYVGEFERCYSILRKVGS